MRKAVQVATNQVIDEGGNFSESLFALCDDGTIWHMWEPGDPGARNWSLLPTIPQGPVKLPKPAGKRT